MVGARRIKMSSQNLDERRLINVVEEMSDRCRHAGTGALYDG